jgi:hypothetical protein
MRQNRSSSVVLSDGELQEDFQSAAGRPALVGLTHCPLYQIAAVNVAADAASITLWVQSRQLGGAWDAVTACPCIDVVL